MRITESQLRQFTRRILLELRDVGGEGPPGAAKYFARPTGTGHVLYYTVGSGGGPKAIPGTIGYYYQGGEVEGARRGGTDTFKLSPEELEQFDRLVDMGLYRKGEAKVEYPDIIFNHRLSDAAKGSLASEWKQASDVPAIKATYSAIDPGYDFLLVDIGKKQVSLDASWSQRQTRRGGGSPTGGGGQGKSYVIPSGDVSFANNTLSLQKLLKHLISVDSRVTPDFTIVSPDDKFQGQTVGDLISQKRKTDVALGAVPGPVVAYHGTSVKRWPAIEKGGLKPGKFETAYVDQIPGYSERNLYFTMDPHTAENYATRAAIWDKSKALVLKVEIPDVTRIVPDEDAMGWIQLDREYTLTQTDRTTSWDRSSGSLEFKRGTKPGETHVVAGEQHPKNLLSFLRQTNTSWRPSQGTDPGPEWKQDSEYAALVADVSKKMAAFINDSLAGETFAYRGPILPKFIKRWKEYPKKAYPKSVDTGEGGSDDDYERTRQEVLGKVKRYDEAALRRLVRMTLLEAESVSALWAHMGKKR